MRQRSILLLLLLIQTINGFSQKPEIALHSSDLGNLDAGRSASQFDNKFKVILLHGGNKETRVPSRLTYQSELHYTMFGSVHSTGGQYERYRSNYLLLPVMVRYNMDNGISLLYGPQLGYLVKAKSIHQQHRYDIRDDMKKLDFLFVAGIEFKTQRGINLGMRYQHGLENSDRIYGMSFRNRGFSLSMKYQLGDSWRQIMNGIFKTQDTSEIHWHRS